MNSGKRVEFDLDPKLWWRLAEKAEEKDVTIPELIRQVTTDYASGRLRNPGGQNKGPDTLLARVAVLHNSGLSDGSIARELKCSPSTVAQKRHVLGLESRRANSNQGDK